MKLLTRHSGLWSLLCLLLWLAAGATAAGQSYTIRFVKGTERFDNGNRTEINLSELVYALSGQRRQLEAGGLAVRLNALQNVADRFDPDARALAFAQAQALKYYLAETCGLAGNVFDIHIDARTDLDNRVIVEVVASAESIISPPTEEDMEPFRERYIGQKEQKRQKEEKKQEEKNQEVEMVDKKQTEKAETVVKAAPAPFLLGTVGIGIKTNALLLAGLLPDGSMYSPVLNAAAEVYFMDRFSAQLSFAYAMAYNKGAKTNLFSMSGFVVEPRWWLRGDGSYRGLYAGVYGQYGTFDVRIKEEFEDNCTGSFYGGGVSVGWLQPVWRGFFAEAGLQVGYRSDAVDVYDYTPGSAYKRLATYTLNSFTLQGFSVAVGYRF